MSYATMGCSAGLSSACCVGAPLTSTPLAPFCSVPPTGGLSSPPATAAGAGVRSGVGSGLGAGGAGTEVGAALVVVVAEVPLAEVCAHLMARAEERSWNLKRSLSGISPGLSRQMRLRTLASLDS